MTSALQDGHFSFVLTVKVLNRPAGREITNGQLAVSGQTTLTRSAPGTCADTENLLVTDGLERGLRARVIWCRQDKCSR
jgi:hypothetical protein